MSNKFATLVINLKIVDVIHGGVRAVRILLNGLIKFVVAPNILFILGFAAAANKTLRNLLL